MIRLASILVLIAVRVAAQDASTLYADGVEALEAGQSERALELFTQAFEMAPDAERGLALAATLQERERFSEAIVLYDRILEGELGELDADRASAIATARRQAERAQAVLHVQVEGDALDVELDDRPVGTVRRGAALTLRLDPGTYRIRGGIDGTFGTPTSIEVGRSERRDVTLVPPEVTPELVSADVGVPNVQPDPPPPPPSPAPWVLLALSAVPAGVGIATGVMFNKRVDRAEAAGNHRDAQPHLDDARPLGRTANASFAVAGAIALTGLIWGIVSRTRDSDPTVTVGLGTVEGSF